MTELQLFAFVILPLSVAMFGSVLAVAGVMLIDWADRPAVAAGEAKAPGAAALPHAGGQ